MKINVVPDEYGACPVCGAYWGHPDPKLDFPNRCKVDLHWKCYNPDCTCGYYDPHTQQVVEDKLSPEEAQALRERVSAQVKAMLADKKWYEIAPDTFQPLTLEEAQKRGLA